MGEMIQVACVCSMPNKTKQDIEFPEINTHSGKYIKRAFYQGIGFMDDDDRRSREVYPCYNCGNLTVTRQLKPKCSNPKCRRRVYDFEKKRNLLKCPYCKKYEMEFYHIGMWD